MPSDNPTTHPAHLNKAGLLGKAGSCPQAAQKEAQKGLEACRNAEGPHSTEKG